MDLNNTHEDNDIDDRLNNVIIFEILDDEADNGAGAGDDGSAADQHDPAFFQQILSEIVNSMSMPNAIESSYDYTPPNEPLDFALAGEESVEQPAHGPVFGPFAGPTMEPIILPSSEHATRHVDEPSLEPTVEPVNDAAHTMEPVVASVSVPDQSATPAIQPSASKSSRKR